MALKIYDKMKPQGNYPAVDAADVEMPDGRRLPTFLEGFVPNGEGLKNAVEEALQQAKDSGEFDGPQGLPGPAGTNGKDGFSPVVSVTKEDGVTTLSITDQTGTHTAQILDGTGGGGGEEEQVILEEQTFSDFTESGGVYTVMIPEAIALTPGEYYKVTWDGKEYICRCEDQVSGAMTFTGAFLGNPTAAFINMPDSGEPFFIMAGGYLATRESGSHTLGIVTTRVSLVTWENIQGKPFEERAVHMEVSTETISNVAFEGLGMLWVKVSTQTLTKEELLGATLRFVSGDYDQSVVISEADVIIANEQGTAVLQQDLMVPFIMVYQPGEMTITFMGQTATVNIPESGCYATGFNLEADGRITIDNQLVKQLDSKFLPMEAIKTYIDDYISEALGGDY